MTPDEVSALIEQIPQGIHVDEFIVMLATKAAEYEREAVLDLVDDYAKDNTDLRDAIHARGQA